MYPLAAAGSGEQNSGRAGWVRGVVPMVDGERSSVFGRGRDVVKWVGKFRSHTTVDIGQSGSVLKIKRRTKTGSGRFEVGK